MTPHSLYWANYLSVALFALGLFGLLVRKNAVIVLMSIELMMNSVNVLLLSTALRTGTPEGIIFIVFVITVAAAEVGIGLGIILNLYRVRGGVDLDLFRHLQG